MKNTLNELIKKPINGYNGAAAKNKSDFHRLAAMQLRALAGALDMASADYDIHNNRGGAAVCGEDTLHSDTFYCQVSKSIMGPGNEIMFRTCKGRTDYTGGPNHYAPVEQLDNPYDFASYLRQCGRFGFGQF